MKVSRSCLLNRATLSKRWWEIETAAQNYGLTGSTSGRPRCGGLLGVFAQGFPRKFKYFPEPEVPTKSVLPHRRGSWWTGRITIYSLPVSMTATIIVFAVLQDVLWGYQMWRIQGTKWSFKTLQNLWLRWEEMPRKFIEKWPSRRNPQCWFHSLCFCRGHSPMQRHDW